MDGYRQSLLGRALADALQELEKEQEEGGGLEVDGDMLFSLFDEAMQLELRDRHGRTFTHESLDVTGQLTAFNRFLGDWSVQAQVATGDLRLDRSIADLHLPQQQNYEQEQEPKVAMRLKLRQRKS